MFQVKLWINDLIPDERNPCTGNENQKKGVDDHVEDPENNMRPGKFDILIMGDFVLQYTLC